MQILVTNDDGIYAPGIAALARAAATLGEVRVVAPVAEQSGVAHSITLMQPLRVVEIERDGRFFGHGVSGAPADCVRLAVRELLDQPPDLLLSGVNLGANVGFNVLYSGTVAAGMEGALLGIPSVAVSIEYGDHPDFDHAARIGVAVARDMLDGRLGAVLLNVNVPCLPPARVRGIRVTRQSRYGGDEGFEQRRDPHGRSYYWFSASAPPTPGPDADTDITALLDGCVSVTPLNHDLTNHSLLNGLRARDWRLPAD